uniref:BESS domain-containing protein n=1 Tax=Caenorhabditis tropicalis TaxID=1561998 RepID=A0A1I7UYW5_9PELO
MILREKWLVLREYFRRNQRNLKLLLEIEKNEKSSFDDVITGAESDNGWEDCLKERGEEEESMDSQWMTEECTNSFTSSSVTIHESYPSSDGPQSFYELDDLNHKPVDNSFRLARVPSQYQLDALSEMFIFDIPQHIVMQKAQESCRPPATFNSSTLDQDCPNDGATPFFVNSEYASEML